MLTQGTKKVYPCLVAGCPAVLQSKQYARRHLQKHIDNGELQDNVELPKWLQSRGHRDRGLGTYRCVVAGCPFNADGKGLVTSAALVSHYERHLKRDGGLRIVDRSVRFDSDIPRMPRRARRLKKTYVGNCGHWHELNSVQ